MTEQAMTAGADLAANLRAEVARSGRRLYDIAARIPMHPATLGQLLRGRRPLTRDVADRVLRALESADVEQRSAAAR